MIDLETWRRLRADVENRWLSGQPPSGAAECGGDRDTDAYVACEGPYLVHVRDPAVNPPNLAAVQEVSAGIYRVARNVSVAGVRALGGRHPAEPAGLSDRSGRVGRRPAHRLRRRQRSPSRTSGRTASSGRSIRTRPTAAPTFSSSASNVRLDRFLPASLGLAMPFTVTYARTGDESGAATGTDLRAASLPGLRQARIVERDLHVVDPPGGARARAG